jgi:hypothetical protein
MFFNVLIIFKSFISIVKLFINCHNLGWAFCTLFFLPFYRRDPNVNCAAFDHSLILNNKVYYFFFSKLWWGFDTVNAKIFIMYKVDMNHEVMGLKKNEIHFTNLYLRRV